jgi:hypothetical protein
VHANIVGGDLWGKELRGAEVGATAELDRVCDEGVGGDFELVGDAVYHDF